MDTHREYSCTAKTKQMLENSLAKLAKEKPLSRITVKEICADADFSRNAFYSHYSDIDALLSDIENRFLTAIRSILSEFSEGVFPDNMLFCLQQFYALMLANKDTALMLLDSADAGLFISGLKETLKVFFYNYFKDFNSPGYKKTYDYFYSFIAEGIIGMLRRWIQEPEDMTKEMLAYLSYVMITRLLQFPSESWNPDESA